MFPWQEKLNEYTEGEPYEVWSIRDRMEVLGEAHSTPETAASFMLRCKTDILYYVNSCVDTYNPRDLSAKEIPLFLEMRQAEYLLHLDWCVKTGKDRVCLKTRYVGASWLEESYDSHGWLFTPFYKSLVGSRTKELVDSKGEGSGDSLFSKFDYIIKRLPPMLKPPGYEAKSPYKVELIRSNPANDASISGEAVTDNFGSGPRATRVFIDELSKCDKQEEAWVACGQTTDSRSGVFTPKGKNFAYGLAFPDDWKKMHNKAVVTRPEVFRIHWKDIPRFNNFYVLDETAYALWKQNQTDLLKGDSRDYQRFFDTHSMVSDNGYSPLDAIPLGMGYDDGKGNITRLPERKPILKMPEGGFFVVYPWYEREKLKYDEVGLAQELDINFDESVSRRVYKVALHLSRTKRFIERDPFLPLYLGLDPGRSRGNAAFLVWCQFNHVVGRYEFVREYTSEGRDAYFYVPLVNGLERDYQYLEAGDPSQNDIDFFEESGDPAWQIDQGFGDPFIENKGASNDSWKSVFIAHDIPLRCNNNAKSPWDRVQALRAMLPFCDFATGSIDAGDSIPYHAGKAYLALSEIKLLAETKDGAGASATFQYEHHPVYSHPVAAVEYIAVNDPHRHDRGTIEGLAQDDSKSAVQRNRAGNSIVRAGADTAGRSLPDGYLMRNGILRSSSEGIDSGYRRRGRDRQLSGYGEDNDRDRSGY